MQIHRQTLFAVAGIAVLGVVVATSSFMTTSSQPEAAAGANMARDGETAVKEEFDAAMKSGTAERLELFVVRHPDSKFAPRAAEALDALRRLGDRPTGKK